MTKSNLKPIHSSQLHLDFIKPIKFSLDLKKIWSKSGAHLPEYFNAPPYLCGIPSPFGLLSQNIPPFSLVILNQFRDSWKRWDSLALMQKKNNNGVVEFIVSFKIFKSIPYFWQLVLSLCLIFVLIKSKPTKKIHVSPH